jgi:cell division protein FtsB
MQALEVVIDTLQREGEELEAAIAEIEAGGPEVERLGREQLGLIKPNEVTYRLVPAGKTEPGLDTEKKNR